MRHGDLTAFARSPAFTHTSTPYLLWTTDCELVDVNPAALRQDWRSREELIGKHLLEIYPESRQTREQGSSDHLLGLLQALTASPALPVHTPWVRWDLPDPDRAGCFIPRTWTHTASAIMDSKQRAAGLLIHCEDVSLIAEQLPPGAATEAWSAAAVATLVRRIAGSARNYRQALDSARADQLTLTDALAALAGWHGADGRSHVQRRRRELWRQITADHLRGGHQDWLDSVCRQAHQVTPVVQGTAMSLQTHLGGIRGLAADGQWASQLESIQEMAGEGPGAEAIRRRSVVQVDRLATERRWPAFTQLASRMGVAACWSLPLVVDGRPIGSITFYSCEQNHLNPPHLADLGLLADLAVPAMLTRIGRLDEQDDIETEPDVVAIAAGMTSVQMDISVPDALARIRAHAFVQGEPLISTAQAIVNGEARLQ